MATTTRRKPQTEETDAVACCWLVNAPGAYTTWWDETADGVIAEKYDLAHIITEGGAEALVGSELEGNTVAAVGRDDCNLHLFAEGTLDEPFLSVEYWEVYYPLVDDSGNIVASWLFDHDENIINSDGFDSQVAQALQGLPAGGYTLLAADMLHDGKASVSLLGYEAGDNTERVYEWDGNRLRSDNS